MVVFPNAKINLGLNVVRKRKDGFHDLATCFVPVPFHDVLEIVHQNNFAFSSSGIEIPGKPQQNLCVKAYRLLKKDFGLQEVNIHLHKIIPIGAGLGGGSADAAYTLRCVNILFELFLDDSLLEDYAAQLGSDCAFFIRNEPVMAYGKGDEFDQINLHLKGKYLALVMPPIHVSTADAYKGIEPALPEHDLKTLLEKSPLEEWKHTVFNDFEHTVFAKYPELAVIKDRLYQQGAVYASMSGSGSTLYGIYHEKPDFQDYFSESQVKIFQL